MPLICGIGFGVMDYLYTNLDYSSQAFQRYMSKRRGDGGLRPGQLCFVDAWEKFAGKPMAEIQKEQGWDRKPDKYNIGGPSIVAMIHAAQLLTPLGVKVRYYGALGKDATAERILEICKQLPLDITHLKMHDKGTSPYAVCLSDPKYNNGHGERSFSVNIGVYQSLDVHEIVDDSFFEGDILYFGATALTPAIHKNLTSLLRRGTELGKLNVVGTVFDHISDSANPGKRWPMGDSDETFRHMGLLMVDWDEAMGISGKTDIDDAIAFFQQMGVKALIVTHGAEELYAYSDGSVFKKMEPRTFPVCKAVADELLANPSKGGDSTGCGDNFAGGVLSYIGESYVRGVKLGNLDFMQAISWGCASGGFTCFLVGGTYIEKTPGEKRKKVEYYRAQYLKQLTPFKL